MAIDNRQKTIDPKAFGKVAVLMGGWSAERTISLRSGQAVLDGLLRCGVDAHGVDVDKATILKKLESGNYDRAFIVLHGPGGEDGEIQAVLDVMDIPYTGSEVLASALGMDKLRSKMILEAAGLPTPDYMVLDEDTDLEYVAATLGLPLMVKPALEGSSIGMTRVNEPEQMLEAYDKAAQFPGAVIAERWIEGGEYTVAILGEQPLPAIKLETPNEFYDYEAKYQSDQTRYLCPCGLDEEQEGQLQRLAMAAFKAIGAKGWGRVDILCSEDGKPWVIELNTVPGMTDHSLVPMAARTAGIEFDQLVCQILAQTLDNHNGNHLREGGHAGAG
jgi:D-alanine-D-alanine ligase